MAYKFEAFINDLIITSDEHRRVNEKSFVMDINGAWGSGKTTFIERFINVYANNEEYEIIKYDAWENDYWDNAFEPIIYNILSNPSFKTINDFDNLMQKAVQEAKKVLFGLGKKVLTKLFTKEGVEALTELKNIVKDNTTDSLLEATFPDYFSFRKSLSDFKESLEKIQKAYGKKIVIIIDELDRCRPDFAVKTLEFVKHIFDIENFIFIFAIDKRNLSSAMKVVYGQDMDTTGYLKRFFDYSVNLPVLNYEESVSNITKVLHIDKKYKIQLYDLLTYKVRTYRELEAFKTVLDLYEGSICGVGSDEYKENLVSMLYIRIFEEELFNKIKGYYSYGGDKRFLSHYCFVNEKVQKYFESILNAITDDLSIEECILNAVGVHSRSERFLKYEDRNIVIGNENSNNVTSTTCVDYIEDELEYFICDDLADLKNVRDSALSILLNRMDVIDFLGNE